jgi:uncharacterized protein (DUF1800 family)
MDTIFAARSLITCRCKMERRTFLTSTGAIGAGTFLSNLLPKATRGASSVNALLGGKNTAGRAGSGAKPLGTESDDLSPYTGTWGDAQLRHLLRRTMFGVPESQFLAAQTLGSMDAVVTKLLACQDTSKVPIPTPFATWLSNYPDYTLTGIPAMNQTRLLATERQEIENWWFDQMVQENLSIRQKMTLMWTNHFVTGSATVQIPAYIYAYLMTCLANALGNFQKFAYAISIDPAMLVYLNGNENYVTKSKSYVNENFARELMELFTLGINFPGTSTPNYTQIDIENSARALTGWRPTTTDPFVGQFNNALHDTTNKTFLGQTGNWTLQDILNIIFEQPTTASASLLGLPTGFPQGYTSAYWACQRMYKEFVYYVPNTSVVDAMARLMLTNNFEIAPVMQALLTSAHFYDQNAVPSQSVIGAQIKSPAEYAGSLVREFGLTYPAFNPEDPPIKNTTNGLNTYTDPNPALSYITNTILNNSQGQQLLNPPNVAGWPGGENWLSAGSFQARQNDSNSILNKKTTITFNENTYAYQIPNVTNSTTAGQLLPALEDVSLAFTLGPIESRTLDPNPSLTIANDLIAAIPTFAQDLSQYPEFQLF